jgi:glyoxylase-like metal-dependent hydrolase (beta-lactamase superfamily II)
VQTRFLLLPALLAAMFVRTSDSSRYHRTAPDVIEVAKGVYCFISQPYGDVGLDGNSVAIVADEGVLVFDANGTPAASAAVLAELRKRTDKPVRVVVYSHWHWDHWYGTETYTHAFADVRVIAHEKARALMLGPAVEFNRPGLEQQLPAYVASLERKAESDPSIRPLAEEDRFFLDQKQHVHLVVPDETYSDRLTVHLGSREIQLLHYGRGVTPGDTLLYLPVERIVISGDLLVNPVSFALGSYPGDWLLVLERIEALAPLIIVPGHGQPLHDLTLLRAHITAMRIMLAAGADARKRGLDADQAKDAVLPKLRDVMVTMTGDDRSLNSQFRTYFVDWYMHRVYDELSGPLTDAIAPIPAK